MAQKGLWNKKRTFLLYLLCTLTSARGGGGGRGGGWGGYHYGGLNPYLFQVWISQVVVYEREGKSVI